MFKSFRNWWNREQIALAAADKWLENLGWESDAEGDYMKELPPRAKPYARKKLIEQCLCEAAHPTNAKFIQVAKWMRLIPRDTADALLRLQVERYCCTFHDAKPMEVRSMAIAAYGLHIVPVDIAARIVRMEILNASNNRNGLIPEGFWQVISNELIVYMLPKDSTGKEWRQFTDMITNQGELDLLEKGGVLNLHISEELRRKCLEGCLKNMTASWRFVGYAVRLIEHFGDIATAKELLRDLISKTNPNYVGFINSLKIFLEKKGVPMFVEAAEEPVEHS